MSKKREWLTVEENVKDCRSFAFDGTENKWSMSDSADSDSVWAWEAWVLILWCYIGQSRAAHWTSIVGSW